MSESIGLQYAHDVSALIRARNSLLWIVTNEEARVERFLIETARTAQYDLRFWDCATGISDIAGVSVASQTTDPANVLTTIRDSQARQIWVLRDFHSWLRDPTVLRALRSLVRSVADLPRSEAKAIVIVTPSSEVPPELRGHAIVLDWPLPDRAEVEEILNSVVDALPDELKASAVNGSREAIIDSAVGLTAAEIQACYAKSLVTTRRIEPSQVSKEKKRVISRERILEWYDPIPGGLEAVGGLEVLKDWLMARSKAFSADAKAFGLPAPRGVLLVGVPGCGKSLTAKAIATAWSMPLLRLDLGALRSKYVGESEGNIRKALKVAETVAPCVLWLDEIEKALSGATQGAADGGVSADALGTILSWMQERQGSVFVVATSNDIRALPPELLRKGRFDEIFWVDLPNPEERKAVLVTALKAHNRTTVEIDFDVVVNATKNFTGAEIAELVPTALFAAFGSGKREITTEDLVQAAKDTTPLARTMEDRIEALRTWAKQRARAATAQTSKVVGNRTLDL